MINSLITIFSVTKDCKGGFLGLDPWYQYLNLDQTTCEIKNFNIMPPDSDIPLVLLALANDLLRIAGLVAVGFVIVGAIQLITSQGNPDDAANAQSTIINALVGLVIAIVAVAFVSFLGSKLGS